MHSSKTRAPMAQNPETAPAEGGAEVVPEKILTVRYSLPEMLEELRHERSAGSMAMEKLHQAQITKLFQNNTKARSRRGKANH